MFGFASTSGSATIRADNRRFLEAFARRIGAGLLAGHPHRRSRYVATHIRSDGLEFRASDWLTALNVGLNEVELALPAAGQVQYRIRYPRWAAYAVGGCGLLGAGFMTVLMVFDIRDYLARSPASTVPGLSLDQNVAIAWAMALFWGFVWPWILIALHKRPVRRLMDRLIAEVDAAAVRASQTP